MISINTCDLVLLLIDEIKAQEKGRFIMTYFLAKKKIVEYYDTFGK